MCENELERVKSRRTLVENRSMGQLIMWFVGSRKKFSATYAIVTFFSPDLSLKT